MFEQNTPEVEIKSPSRLKPLLGVLLVLAGVALYAFFTRSLSGDVADAKSKLTQNETEITAIESKLALLQSAEQQYGLTTQVDKFETLKSVPQGMNQDDVIRDLINIAGNYKVKLHSIGFSRGSSAQEGVSTLGVSASFEGNYSDLISFLEGIEQNGRTFRVNSISVQINTLEVTEIKRATFSLSMDAFYQE